MIKYLINRNAQVNGDHEVHKESCSRLPILVNRHYIGEFSTCMEALVVAKRLNPKADGCAKCSPACHTS